MSLPSGDPASWLRLGAFATITDALAHAATTPHGLFFHSPRGEKVAALPYRELRGRALSLARRLVAAGLRPGDRVALVAETGPDFPVWLFACFHAGIVPAIAPAETNVLARASYLARMAGIVEACGARALLVPDRFPAELPVRLLCPGELQALPEADTDLPLPRPQDPAYVQFSSGSTTAPKGVLIRHGALMANIAQILRFGIRLNDADRAFSWLPFYHDMGLVGFLLAPLSGPCSVDYLPPAGFARRPALWPQLMASLGSTISYAPTFGYRLAAERVRDADLAGVDLSRWRLAGVGGDMVRAEALEAFAARFAPAGFDRIAFVPSYGLAEATLAVSFATDGLRLALPRAERSGEARPHVICGRPLPGMELRIVDGNGRPVADGAVGRIEVRGPSLMAGYVRPTEAGLTIGADGFLDTGDLGFLTEGALVVTGRAKDLILVNGRNIWPADLEWAAQQAAGLRHGQVVAFPLADAGSAAGSEEVVVLVECRDADAMESLRPRIADAISRQTGVAAEIVFVPPRTIPLTSSGKLRRSAARDAYLAGLAGGDAAVRNAD